MTSTAEFANRILATLHEAHADNVYALLNTIAIPRDNPEDVRTMAGAISGLLESDHVYFGTEEFSPRNETVLPKVEAQLRVQQLDTLFQFDAVRRKWNVKSGEAHKQRIPFIRLTSSGLAEAEQLLATRGYSWWTKA